AFESISPARLTGLRNLGNSCYMASTSILTLPAFRTYHPLSFLTHACSCTEELPIPCFDFQMCKIADRIRSGWLSHPRSHFPSHTAGAAEPMPSTVIPRSSPTPLPVFQEPIKPTMFKSLIGSVHEEISMTKQQDAQEFFAYIFLKSCVSKLKTCPEPEPTVILCFEVEQQSSLCM
ncbi:hypothetical protein BU17DRAFT_36241, partial [Hysterangium stoloniferum]